MASIEFVGERKSGIEFVQIMMDIIGKSDGKKYTVLKEVTDETAKETA